MSVFNPENTGAGGELDVGVTGNASEAVLPAAEQTNGLNAQEYDSFEEGYVAFQNGEVDAVLNVTRNSDGRLIANVYAPDTGVRNTVIVVRLQGMFESLQNQERERLSPELSYQPLSLDGDGDEAPFHSFSYTVLLPLLLFLPAFISGSLASDAITEGVAQGTIQLLRVAPVTEVDIIEAKVGAVIGLAPLQAALWLVLLEMNGIVISNPVSLVVFTFGITLVVGSLGTLVSLRYPDRSKAQFLYSALVVAVFSVATLLPQTPVNAVARLAIGSETLGTYGTVGLFVAAGIIGMIALRMYIKRSGIPSRTD